MTARISSIQGKPRGHRPRLQTLCEGHSLRIKAAKPYPYGVWQQVCRKELRIPSQDSACKECPGMQAIKVLRKDHSTVRSLFDKLERTAKSSHEKKNDLFEQIRRELQLHMRAEEEIFYPALKAFDGEGCCMVAEAFKEHRDIDQFLTQISHLNPNDKNYNNKVET